MSYTKGPWKPYFAEEVCIGGVNVGPGMVVSASDADDSEDVCIVALDSTPTNEKRANAYILAAAPELLEALKDARDMLTSHPDFQEAGSLDLYDKTIAKAEGRS